MNAFPHPDRPLSAGRAAVVLALLSAVATPLAAQVVLPAPACVLPFDPVQINPPAGRPTGFPPPLAFPSRDHLFVHSATHLQGAPDTTKIAAGLIQRPNDDLAGMTSALSVTNPDPLRSATVTVTFLNHLGTDMSLDPNPSCQTPSFTLIPEETRILPAVPLDPATGCTVGTSRGEGVGSARISVAQGDPGIVGAVIHHTYCFFGTVCDTDSLPLSNTPPPGAAAMEQLQSIQDTDEVWAGPFPLTAAMPVEDVLNGMAPIVSVTNPSTAAIVAAMDLVIFTPATGTSTTVPFRAPFVIPAGGTWIESTGVPLNEILGITVPPFPAGLWQQSIFNLLTTPTTDLDISVRVRSFGTGPILGNVLYTDFFANTATGNLTLGERFRMASTVLQGKPTGYLMNPEFSFEPRPDQLMETYVLLQNVGPQATSLGIDYFDNLGNLMATAGVASLAPNQVLRIVPGTFNYPAGPAVPGGPTGFGWMRFRACQPSDQLIGWTVREIFDPPFHAVYHPDGDHEDHFMKAFGEILMSTADAEPGNGFQVTIGPTTRTRKVSPLIRVDDSPSGWPGYSTAVNDSVSNLFDYEWRIFGLAGNACGTSAFPGLPFRFTTFTYEDPETLPACTFFGPMTGSARIDVSTGTVDGLGVTGDPMREWNIPNFADGQPLPIGGGSDPDSDSQP